MKQIPNKNEVMLLNLQKKLFQEVYIFIIIFVVTIGLKIHFAETV